MTNRSLTRDEAVRRAALLDVTSYDVALRLDAGTTFGSRSTVAFSCAEPGAETFVEVGDAVSCVAVLNGEQVPAEAHEGNRVVLRGLAARNELVVDATMPCGTTGDAMHRYVDPADGATYLSAYCGGDVAHRVFGCFDQPDLKAPITLTVDAPDDWTVLANGRLVGVEGRVRRYATTPPVSTYLFVVCAGPWHSVTWEHAGLPFGWHARRSLAPALERDIAELRRVTEACFDHYARIFDEPYAFDSYDQVFAPGLNWGALETPGCVTFRDEMVFPGGGSPAEREHRAVVIAHEMAHMWFGDLATLRWWEDIWLNESFADYMGYQVAAAATGATSSWAEFTVRRKPTGYAADERRSTHPVAPKPESVVDADTGFANTDMIAYAKGNSVLRQLVTWLGEETFLRGANRYLTEHRFGNAELADFIDALDGVSERDVRPWAEAWLRSTGFDTLAVRREEGVPVLTRRGSRPHRTRVVGYRSGDDGALVEERSEMLDLANDDLRLEEWSGLVVLPNASDETFARLRPDEQSVEALLQGVSSLEDGQARAVVWATAFDLAHGAELSPRRLLELVGRHLVTEPVPTIWEPLALRLLGVTGPRLLPPDGVAEARAVLARLAEQPATDALRLPAAQVLAACTDDVERLERWLAEDRCDLGVRLDPDLRWRVLGRLAQLGAVDERRIDSERAAAPSRLAELGAARALAAVPTSAAKDSAWALLSQDDVDNRVFRAAMEGLWTPEQAGLVAPYVERYLAEAPDWARRRGQGFSREIGGVFPVHAVSQQTRDGVRDALAGDLPTVLRRAWNDRLDDLEADLRVRERFG